MKSSISWLHKECFQRHLLENEAKSLNNTSIFYNELWESQNLHIFFAYVFYIFSPTMVTLHHSEYLKRTLFLTGGAPVEALKHVIQSNSIKVQSAPMLTVKKAQPMFVQPKIHWPGEKYTELWSPNNHNVLLRKTFLQSMIKRPVALMASQLLTWLQTAAIASHGACSVNVHSSFDHIL